MTAHRYRERLVRRGRLMTEAGWAALLLTKPGNMLYRTGGREARAYAGLPDALSTAASHTELRVAAITDRETES